jgi:hypothetical protein
LSSVGYRENGGSAIYHGLVLVAERKLKNGLQYQVSHTWAKNLDDADKGAEGAVGGVENAYDRRAERGNNTYTRRHRFVVSSLYEVPFGRAGITAAPWLKHLVGGWALSGFVLLQTGEYYNPTFSGSDPANVGASGGRPDRIGSGVLSNPTIERWFDASAFVVPPKNAGRFGNSGVNILCGPGAQIVNLGLFKRVSVRENLRLQVEATATNAFNHPNFGTPRSSITSSGPGTITGTQSLEGTGARTIRLGARLDF